MEVYRTIAWNSKVERLEEHRTNGTHGRKWHETLPMFRVSSHTPLPQVYLYIMWHSNTGKKATKTPSFL